MHHIVSDGWSHGRARRASWRALYAAFRAGRPSPLPELPVQYADYARLAARAGCRARCWSGSSAYWREQLAGAPDAAGAAHRPPAPAGADATRGATCRCELAAELARAARRRWRASEGATLFMMLLAAFQVLLARYTGQDDLVVGTPDRRTARGARSRG